MGGGGGEGWLSRFSVSGSFGLDLEAFLFGRCISNLLWRGKQSGMLGCVGKKMEVEDGNNSAKQRCGRYVSWISHSVAAGGRGEDVD